MELIQAVCLTPAFELLEKRGANVEKHLQKVNLDAFSPRNPRSWLPKELVFRFIERIDKRELSNKPIEDLESVYRIRNTHHYGQYLLSAPTMLTAARRATNPKAAVMTYHTTRVGLHRGRASFRSFYNHKRDRTELIIEGLSLVLMLDALMEFGGKDSGLSALDITLDHFPETTLPIDWSKTKVSIARSAHNASFPISWLARRPKTYVKNPNCPLWAGDLRFSNKLLRLLDALEPGKRPTLEFFAESTGIPTRTIQRKLTEENTSFFDMVDQWAARSALAAMQDPRISITEVSESLGYSDPCHFSRAFNRWMGQSPKSYRDTLG